MRHIIDAIAAQGRNGDDELLHVTKGEMAGLEALARKHFGRNLPRNPKTGLKEASLFQDWLGKDVGMAMDVAAPVAVGFIPGVGIPAAVAMGAATGAANQGLGKGGTTESALMGGVMGGIGAYGGAGMAEGLAGSATAAAPTTGMTTTATPLSSALPAGAETIATAAPGEATMSIADAGNILKPATSTSLQAPSTAMSNVAPTIQGSTAAGAPVTTTAPTTAANTGSGLQATAPNGAQIKSIGGETGGTNWNYLTTKDALGPVTQIGTSALGTAEMPSGQTDTTSGIPSVNKTLPKSEVYYTPYGERRTRIVAAEGGLMSMNGAYGDYDGAEDGQGIRRFGGGGLMGTGWGEQNRGGFAGLTESLQPGGAFGDLHGKVYGALGADQIMPGGAMGSLVPGANQYNAKKREEEEAKANEEKAKVAAAQKAQQEQQFRDQWSQRYSAPIGMAEGGYTGPRDGDAVKAVLSMNQPKEESAFNHPIYRSLGISGIPRATDKDWEDWRRKEAGPNAFESPIIQHIAGGYNSQQRMAGGGITNIAAAKGRYLQGAGDGMSDSIKANIDGKQEARLATGEFVVPADVVSHLGNGDSSAGAKQLHSMMDRARMTRTGTKKQGKQINPRKVMPV